jgi:hypothetical protein
MSSRRPKKRLSAKTGRRRCSISQNNGHSDGATPGPQGCWTDLSFAMPVQIVSANRSSSGALVFRDSKLVETDASRSAASITRSASLSLAPFSKASKACVKSSGIKVIPSRRSEKPSGSTTGTMLDTDWLRSLSTCRSAKARSYSTS